MASHETTKRLWMFSCAFIFLLGSIVAVRGDESKKTTRVPVPKITTDKGDKCVEPTEDMRRNHMHYILHQRDETVHRGIRTKRHSLRNCIECHADPKTHSVIGENGFCETCHAYTAVTIDCFGCHTPKREATLKTTSPNNPIQTLILERLVRETPPAAKLGTPET